MANMKKLIVNVLIALGLSVLISTQSWANDNSWQIKAAKKECDFIQSLSNVHTNDGCQKLRELLKLQSLQNESDNLKVDNHTSPKKTLSESNPLSEFDLNRLSADAENTENLVASCLSYIRVNKTINNSCTKTVEMWGQILPIIIKLSDKLEHTDWNDLTYNQKLRLIDLAKSVGKIANDMRSATQLLKQ